MKALPLSKGKEERSEINLVGIALQERRLYNTVPRSISSSLTRDEKLKVDGNLKYNAHSVRGVLIFMNLTKLKDICLKSPSILKNYFLQAFLVRVDSVFP